MTSQATSDHVSVSLSEVQACSETVQIRGHRNYGGFERNQGVLLCAGTHVPHLCMWDMGTGTARQRK